MVKKRTTLNDSNIFQVNITTEWRELKKLIHNKKIEVSKEIEIMENLQTEWWWNTMGQTKSTVESIIHRMDHVEEEYQEIKAK